MCVQKGEGMNALSQRLRELRQRHGYSVRKLADLLDRTPGYVSRIEGRGEIPSPELLCRIAEVYRVDPKELLELAKRSQLEQTEKNIDEKQASALTLYRKGKR
jgi:transcriptional regulator with XRE-family HTH domain